MDDLGLQNVMENLSIDSLVRYCNLEEGDYYITDLYLKSKSQFKSLKLVYKNKDLTYDILYDEICINNELENNQTVGSEIKYFPLYFLFGYRDPDYGYVTSRERTIDFLNPIKDKHNITFQFDGLSDANAEIVVQKAYKS